MKRWNVRNIDRSDLIYAVVAVITFAVGWTLGPLVVRLIVWVTR